MRRLLLVLSVTLRIVTLLVTGWLLIATSPYDDGKQCSIHMVPAPFYVSGTCGPDGIIVVSADGTYGELWIDNPGLIGLPPARTEFGETWNNRIVGGGHGLYVGTSCPFFLSAGEWVVFGREQHLRSLLGDAGVHDASLDAVVQDAALSPDAPQSEDAETVQDADDPLDGEVAVDAGAVAVDAGAVAVDAGAVARDAGAVARDAGAVARDAGAVAMDAGAVAEYRWIYAAKEAWNVRDVCWVRFASGRLLLSCEYEGVDTCESVLAPLTGEGR